MYFRLSQAPSQYYCLVCAVYFQDILQQLLICPYCTSSHHRAIYFESRIHKVTVELPNIIEGLVGVQLCVLFLLQICLTDGTVIQPLASGIVPTEIDCSSGDHL